MQTMVELTNVSKRYGHRPALDNVTLSIGRGVTGLLGPNGSGKSTMIKSMLGLLRIQAGSASVLGHKLPKQVLQIREQVGYMPEDDCFIAGLSGIESVRYMAELSGLHSIEALRRGHEVLDYADIGQERYRNVETYSTGMRQKLKFAQAIVHDPAFLVLDEPTNGLDPEQRTSMLRKIKILATSHAKSILISTHILHDVRTVCDQVVIMSSGKIRLVDSLDNLSKPSRVGMLVVPERLRDASAEDPFPDSRLLQQNLSELGVESEMRTAGQVWVSGVEVENCEVIWRAARAAEVHIEKLASAKNSLEEIFFKTVKEAEHASA